MRIDLHCDSLTAKPLFDGQINLQKLRAGEDFQCFAAFTEDGNAAAYAAAVNLFKRTFTVENGFMPIRRYADVEYAQRKGLVCSALTCENIGFTGGGYENIRRLKSDGVIMASLVWNNENSLAYPNVRADGKNEKRGLKKSGEEALEALDDLKIIVDLSHLSDGGVSRILRGRKRPLAASHSDCRAVCKNVRNLTDLQLKKIADCGGVVGVNFYVKFLGGDGGFAAAAAHLKHIIKVAGEDTPAFGSDWDGTPCGGVKINPQDMAELKIFLKKSGFSNSTLEKIFCGNFLRVFKEIVG